MVNELPEDLEQIEDELPGGEVEEVVENTPEETPEVDEIAELRAQVEKFQNVQGLADDLRRSAGRIQSLEQRIQQDAADKEALTAQIDEQFTSVNELLTGVVENIDETALDPTTKARVREAYNASLRAKETASLRKEVQAEVLESIKKEYPQLADNTPNQTGSSELLERAVTVEQRAVDIFGTVDQDPDAPEHAELWAEAATMMKANASDNDVVKMFQTKLRANSETPEEGRRQRTKELAGAGTPDPAGASVTPDLTYKEDDPEGNMEQLRELGINV